MCTENVSFLWQLSSSTMVKVIQIDVKIYNFVVCIIVPRLIEISLEMNANQY